MWQDPEQPEWFNKIMRSQQSESEPPVAGSATGSGASACDHRTTYYNAEHDNFYCKTCRKGMGQDYYNLNIGHVTAQPPNDQGQR